jgi:uncharacterized repeat protein (TIGR01451 family)
VALPFRGLRVSLRPGNADAYVSDGIGSVDVVSLSAATPPVMAVIGSLAAGDFVLDAAPVEFSDANTYLYLAHSGSGLSIASAPKVTPQNVNLDRLSYVLPEPGIASVVAGLYPQAFVYSNSSKQWTVNTSNLNALNVVGPGNTTPASVYAMTPYIEVYSGNVHTNALLISAGLDGVLRYALNPGGDPVYSDTLSTGGTAYETAVAWPYATVANGTSGLAVFKFADAFTDTDPVTMSVMSLIGTAPSPSLGAFRHVAVQGNHAYIGDDGGVIQNNGTFRVYDLTDPTIPVATGSVSQTGILDIKLSGNLAFLAVGSQGIRVVDITNPVAPVIINTDDYTGTTSAQSLVVYQHFLFVSTGDAGVQMLSFNATGQLSLITTIPTSGSAVQLAWVPGQLYVADDIGGLAVLQVGNDVAITKTAPASVYAGQNFTYTLSATNVGISPATGVVITDSLPVEVSLISAQNCATGGGIVTCTVPSLAVGAGATFNVVVKSDVTDVISNTARVSSNELDVDTTNNSSSVTTAILPAADLTLTKIDVPDPVYVGSRLAYTLTVGNSGPSDATGVVVTDTLPAGVTFASASAGCSGTTTIVCNAGALTSGANASISIAVTVTASANSTITNTAVATANEKDFTPATVTASTTVLAVADLSITKVGAPNPVYINQPLTYTLVIANLGPSTATSVLMTDTLPLSVTFKSVSGGVCNGTSVVVCNLGSLTAGSMATVTLVVTPTSITPPENSATVMSGVFDPVLQNNTVGPVITTVIKYKIMLPLVRR